MRQSGKLICLIALLAAFVCVAMQPAAAQDLDNVTISGKVSDQNGAVVPGASVTAVTR